MPTAGLDLKLERVRANLTITQVAAQMGLSRQAVSVIEARAIVNPERVREYLTAVAALRDAIETPRSAA